MSDEEKEGDKSDIAEEQAKTCQDIARGSVLSQSFLLMNLFATVVAAYGLLENSAAVVIGAMIIATLYGPIMGIALGLVDGNGALLKRALLAEVVGAAMVVVIGACIGRLHMDLPVTAEILSRTKPNLLDLAIALAAGAAGAYATVSPRLSLGLVGVAISTALVPPLAVCGICLSRGLMDQATGAAILFATNLITIQCVSSIALFAFGFHHVIRKDSGGRLFVTRLVLDAGVFAVLAVFLFFQLSSTVQQQQFEEGVKTSLTKGLHKIPGAFLAETRFNTSKDTDIVVAVVRVPTAITPDQTLALQKALTPRSVRPIELHVRSLLTKEATAEGFQYQIKPTAPPVDEIPSPEQQAAIVSEAAPASPVPTAPVNVPPTGGPP